MDWNYLVIISLSYLNFIQTEDYLSCIIEDNPKTRTFKTLVQYQANKLSFNPHEQGFDGNYVNFSFYTIDRLPKNAFISFSSQNVIGIDLRNKSIKTIDEGAFLFIFCLHYLDLSNNKISNLTEDMFQGLDKLRALNISGNKLKYLYNGVFSHLKSIQILDISHNIISDLDKSALYNISTLEKLMLSYNCIKRFKSTYFSQLTKLKELYIDHNAIALLPSIFFTNNVYLETLDVSGNGLVLWDMPNDTSKLSSLNKLNLSDNYLITLHVENISYHFPNNNLTIDFNNNQFYCISWKNYLNEFKEKHINIAPGRNFSQEYYLDGIACDTLNFSLNGTSSEEDTYTLNADLDKNSKRYRSRLNRTFDNVLRELNNKEDELSHKHTYKADNATPDKLPLVRHDNSTTPSNIKEGADKLDNGTMKGVTIAVAVIGVVFSVLVIFDYVLRVGLLMKLRRRLRHFLSPSGADDNEYLTLSPPS